MKYSKSEITAADGLLQLQNEPIKFGSLEEIYAKTGTPYIKPKNTQGFTNMTKDALLHRIKSKLMRMKVNDVKRIYRSIAQS